METEHLYYNEVSGTVWIKPADERDDDDSVWIGRPGCWRSCPDELVEEMDELLGLIREAERYGAACERTATNTYDETRFH